MGSLYYGADSFDSVLEGVHNVIRLTFAGPFRIQPVTGTDKERGRPGGEAGPDVGALVAHHEGAGEFSLESPPAFLDESGFWFAASTAVFWRMRAGVDRIQGRSSTGEELDHAPIDRIERFGRAASSRDHRLIADHHDRTA